MPSASASPSSGASASKLTSIFPQPSLAAVNFFLGCVGTVQVSRIYLYKRSVEGSAGAAAKDMEHAFTDATKSIGKKTEDAAEKSG